MKSSSLIRPVQRRRRPVGSTVAPCIDISAPPDPAEQFTQLVESTLDGPVLRYTQRQQLLAQAQRLGIGRFHANLLIASALHEKGIGQEYHLPPTKRWAPAVLAFAVTQAAIVAGVWWVLR